MREFAITVERSGATIASRAVLADGHLSRMKGLLGRRSLDEGEALILRPCSSIHTWFMRMSLDVLFVDKERRVLKVVRRIGPWRFSAARHAAEAIEFEAGALDDIDLAPGDRLVLSPVTPAAEPSLTRP